MQVQPLLFSGQLVPALNVCGLTDRNCPFDKLQCQGTRVVYPGPVKLRTALAGQLVFGTEIVTWTDSPGNNLPCDGLKVMPLIPLADTFQSTIPWKSGEGASVTAHDRQPLSKLPGLAISPGEVQFHGTLRGFFAPRKVKVAVAGQVVLGTKTATDIG